MRTSITFFFTLYQKIGTSMFYGVEYFISSIRHRACMKQGQKPDTNIQTFLMLQTCIIVVKIYLLEFNSFAQHEHLYLG